MAKKTSGGMMERRNPLQCEVCLYRPVGSSFCPQCLSPSSVVGETFYSMGWDDNMEGRKPDREYFADIKGGEEALRQYMKGWRAHESIQSQTVEDEPQHPVLPPFLSDLVTSHVPEGFRPVGKGWVIGPNRVSAIGREVLRRRREKARKDAESKLPVLTDQAALKELARCAVGAILFVLAIIGLVTSAWYVILSLLESLKQGVLN